MKKKKLSANRVSWYITGVNGSLIIAGALWFYFTNPGTSKLLLIIIPLFSILLVFLFAHFILNLFLKDQISHLYETVNEMALRKVHFQNNSSKDIITEVEDEVKDWAKERKKEVEKLKDLEIYRKEFLGNVYHELKTPIFNIQGYILTLLEGGIQDKSVNKLYLERAEKNINRMISIVEDLETISRLESGAMSLNKEKFNIRKSIEDVFEANEIRASQQRIDLVLESARGEPVIVKADRKRIYQVLNNLVINSINYGTKNGSTRVILSKKGDKVVVEVSDNGIGIGRSDMKRVFERFYRVDKSRSRDSGGTGLGLSIVKHIVEAHNQKLKLSSTPGKGSKFRFTLDAG